MGIRKPGSVAEVHVWKGCFTVFVAIEDFISLPSFLRTPERPRVPKREMYPVVRDLKCADNSHRAQFKTSQIAIITQFAR